MGRIDGAYEPGFFSWRELHAEALVALNRLDEAEEALVPYEAMATARGARSSMAGAARARGQLEAAKGDTEQAIASFETGASLIRNLPMPFALGLIEDSYGRFLRRARRRRDAAAHLGEAHRLFAGLGARPYAEECERELDACGLHPAKRKVRDPTRLTPQELAVTRLVASGLTNAQAAQRLVVSVKTVEVHLGRVFSKLGITSRHQLPSHPVLEVGTD